MSLKIGKDATVVKKHAKGAQMLQSLKTPSDSASGRVNVITGQAFEQPEGAKFIHCGDMAFASMEEVGDTIEFIQNSYVKEPSDCASGGCGKSNFTVSSLAMRKKEKKDICSWELLLNGDYTMKTKPISYFEKKNGTVCINNEVYQVYETANKVAFLIKVDPATANSNQKRPLKICFFGQCHIERISVDQVEITPSHNSSTEGGFVVFRIRENCVAFFVNNEDDKKRLIGDIGTYVVEKEKLKHLRIYDFNVEDNYGDSQIIQACRLQRDDWIWYYSEADLKKLEMLSHHKTQNSYALTEKEEILKRIDTPGIHIIFDSPSIRFHTDPRDDGKPKSYPQAPGSSPEHALSCDFLNSKGRFELCRIFAVPQNLHLYYVEEYDVCELVSLPGYSVEDIQQNTVETLLPSVRVAFVRAKNGIVFSHDHLGCEICECSDGTPLTDEQLKDFDEELGTKRSKRRSLLDREVERANQILKNEYYTMAKTSKIVGNNRARDFLWNADNVRLTFDSECRHSAEKIFTVGQFLILEVPENAAAIVAPITNSRAFETLNDASRSRGYLQYGEGFITINLLTSKLLGIWPTMHRELCEGEDTDKNVFIIKTHSIECISITVRVVATYYMCNPIVALRNYFGKDLPSQDQNEALKERHQVKGKEWFRRHIAKDLKPIITKMFTNYAVTHKAAEISFAQAPVETLVELDQDEENQVNGRSMMTQLKNAINKECAKRGLALDDNFTAFFHIDDDSVTAQIADAKKVDMKLKAEIAQIEDRKVIAAANLEIAESQATAVKRNVGVQGMLHNPKIAIMTTNNLMYGREAQAASSSPGQINGPTNFTMVENHNHLPGSDTSRHLHIDSSGLHQVSTDVPATSITTQGQMQQQQQQQQQPFLDSFLGDRGQQRQEPASLTASSATPVTPSYPTSQQYPDDSSRPPQEIS